MNSKWPEVPLDSLKADAKSAFAMGPFGSNIKSENFVSVGVPVIKGGTSAVPILMSESLISSPNKKLMSLSHLKRVG